MKSASYLIEQLKKLQGKRKTRTSIEVEIVYIAPTLHIDVISELFSGKSDEERRSILSQKLVSACHLPTDYLDTALTGLPLILNTLTKTEVADKLVWTQHRSMNSWVSSFLDSSSIDRSKIALSNGQQYIHFYGYKGGQARSSVLGLLAKSMADDGYNILIVDADIEAPSIDNLLGVFAEGLNQTLMGMCGWGSEVHPIAGAYAGKAGGRIDVIPCRPRGEFFDLDFALLIATAPMDVRMYERAAQKLHSYASNSHISYDAIFIDHRTGIASSVLPLMNELPGPSVIFARTDSNLSTIPTDLKRVIRSIFSSSPELPGAYVSFSLDTNRKTEQNLQGHSARIREALLSELALTVEERNRHLSPTDSTTISAGEMSVNWIDWYLDRAMLETNLPDVGKLQSDNMSSLTRLREVLGLPLERRAAVLNQKVHLNDSRDVLLSVSGAKDQGQFIHIPDVERLFVDGNPYSYILGRKGTGKTRLLREIAVRSLGTPILVASDETTQPAMRSQSVEANTWLTRCNGDASVFWWSLIHLAVQGISVGLTVKQVLEQELTSTTQIGSLGNPLKVKKVILSLDKKHSLLVDGLENLVSSDKIKSFVSGLFEVMAAIQNDPQMAERITVRAFVREDLASDAIQNVEQQMEGRLLRLKWSSTSILNFAVSRIPYLPWINATFTDVCNEILKKATEIQRSTLPEQEAMELLLRIFPSRIRRNNLSTATFLRLYFSDAGGDDTNKATFYPRLYLSFLQKLNDLAGTSASPITEDSRIVSSLLNNAYDEASSEFINETKQELTFLLSLKYSKGSPSKEDDQARVARFVSAFDGLSTPFEYDQLVDELVNRTSFTELSVRESLRQMKAIRMFEDRPGFAGWWRVGQLYKTGLRMKYVR
jgi:Mrp family chromosome partitioning ATPase